MRKAQQSHSSKVGLALYMAVLLSYIIWITLYNTYAYLEAVKQFNNAKL